ncbi:MAG: DUF5011 domain-containing protein [Candidatus Kerfeldbacteria bacterium]|nr:DUF5011 domain-containing protein [Candidatus Kerfeldbacteria bacterium]
MPIKLLSITSCIIVGVLFSQTASAKIFIVDVTDDPTIDGSCNAEEDGGGICSLREAINKSNSTGTDDTINLVAGTYTLSLTAGADSGDLEVDKSGTTVTITGAGASTTIIDANGSVTSDRAFRVQAGTVELTGLTFSNGLRSSNTGAGLRVDSGATLTATEIIVENNSAVTGGGITNQGTISLIDSIIRDNTASVGQGGGIYNLTGAGITITGTTISNNIAAGAGGGIFSQATLTVTNTTISGNTSTTGGGIHLTDSSTSTLIHNTIYNNTAAAGGGGIFWSTAVTATMRGNIFSGNIDTSNVAPECTGQTDLTSGGYNLVTTTTGCTDKFTLQTTDLVNVAGDFSSSGLTDNGGFSPTVALAATSPAINVVPSVACVDADGIDLTTDQRSLARSGYCDIGAYEYQDSTAPTLTLLGDETITLIVGDSYTEAGATAVDDIDGDVTANIVIDSSAVNTAVPGTYLVTYTATDLSNNSSTAERTIEVLKIGGKLIKVKKRDNGTIKLTYANGTTETINPFSGKKKFTYVISTNQHRLLVTNGQVLKVYEDGDMVDHSTIGSTSGTKRVLKLKDFYNDNTDDIILAVSHNNQVTITTVQLTKNNKLKHKHRTSLSTNSIVTELHISIQPKQKQFSVSSTVDIATMQVKKSGSIALLYYLVK